MRKELENIIQKQVRKIAHEQGFPIHKNLMYLEKSKSMCGLYHIKGNLGSFFIKNADSDKPTMVYFEDAYSRKGRREIPLYETNDSKTSYKNYQLQWMIDHGYSLRDLMQSMDEYYDDKYDTIGRSFDNLFTEWQNESGFNHELWSCKEEAINAEECNDTSKEEIPDIKKMIERKDVPGKEPTDFEGTLEELAEHVMDLSTKQPDGMIHDADTILADIMEAADFQVSGISDDILKLYLEVENKDDFESLFYLMADEKFENYLLKSKEIMEQNIAESKHSKYKLTEKGEKIVLDFITKSYKTQNILRESGVETTINAGIPSLDDVIREIESEKYFEEDAWHAGDKYYSNVWYITDHFKKGIILKYGEDFVLNENN